MSFSGRCGSPRSECNIASKSGKSLLTAATPSLLPAYDAAVESVRFIEL